jgi:hypothetical protein
MSKASNQNLDLLHAALADALANRIASGEATASDLAVAAKFLKDNGVSRLLDKNVNALAKAAAEMSVPDPEAEPEDYDNIAALYQ